ncbi:2-octaprenyl-6-methoxyphenyl hydroxylase [Chromohalobacter israelensis]|uniref:2-octaprenyl-6-methoxyphenol hydroxylase / 2-octaprenyl-3-methyl-6-methoxy-1,4-benzoquinol hydroxylase n=1 Tax=Chromohalobacter israelensis (strain ATCC BAA-138 / DSM 3043 / CIP 106854 / NCIMB 13768 / 1H11) TaxID=290398 RepID=Q1R1L8_CHRI1|nr:2-octaprenyl-6-methoxyphenyl hydroxylase [Chromohalobacter salexigens]ABE57390.1 2-octaprenyl-6-methoxyphenol hydroxylase / 2-octaprenyl-3-methyl-6-methoxy-1,4-benzoquinol hydroxylase [Chromohalobacter salexigens DSM 3043]
MPRNRVDIAIVGGGLVGASLACALAPLIERHGLRVAVIEAAPLNDAQAATFQPSFDARASAIAQGSRRHFERLGVWATMAERATPIRQIHVSERGRFGATRLTADEFDLDALGYVIPNAWMGQVLHAALGALPLTWHCPARVDDIVPIADGHRLALSDGACLEAGLTVLADGGRSGLKERLGIASQAQPYEQHALIANVEVGRDHGGVAYERFSSQGPMALLPMAGRRMALVWTHASERREDALAWSDDVCLRRLQDAFGDRLGRFRRIGRRDAYPLSLVTANEPVRPHLAVLGNAAHALHPVAGQGFNLALRGVMDLVATLEDGLSRGQAPGGAGLLGEFENRRAADRRNVIRFSDGLIRLFGIEHAAFSHLRAAGLVGLNIVSPLRRTLARRAMGLER